MNKKSVRLPEIHRLRGVAILMIVAAHCYQFFSWANKPVAEAIFKDVFDNSSLIFVFVAGFLFQYTEEHRFSYSSFFFRKIKNIFLPYIIALVPAIVYVLLRGSETFSDVPFRDFSTSAKILYMLVYPGVTVNAALWFIPVIAIYYLASPLLRTIDQRQWYWLIFALLPLSLLMHRPTYSQGHNLSLALYFLSAYMFGMFCSRYREQVFAWLDVHLVALTIVFAVVFIGHLLLSDHHGKSQTHEPFETQGGDGLIDWIYLQKFLMTAVLLGFFRSFRNQSAKTLDYLASASFTIFFYHLYALYVVKWGAHFTKPEFRPDYLLLLFTLAIGVPCLIALGARKLFPLWSRQLVGA